MIQRSTNIGLQLHLLAPGHPGVGSEDDAAVAVVDAARERLGAESAQHDEWIAPIRVQASIATAASRIIGR